MRWWRAPGPPSHHMLPAMCRGWLRRHHTESSRRIWWWRCSHRWLKISFRCRSYKTPFFSFRRQSKQISLSVFTLGYLFKKSLACCAATQSQMVLYLDWLSSFTNTGLGWKDKRGTLTSGSVCSLNSLIFASLGVIPALFIKLTLLFKCFFGKKHDCLFVPFIGDKGKEFYNFWL